MEQKQEKYRKHRYKVDGLTHPYSTWQDQYPRNVNSAQDDSRKCP